MSINHTNKVIRVRKIHNVGGVADVVSVVELSFIAQTTDDTGSIIADSETIPVRIFDSGDTIDSNNFTHFDELSEEQVIQWALSKVSVQVVSNIKQSLEGRLNARRSEADVMYNPWNNIDMTGKVITTTIPWDQVNTTPTPKE